jgi:hypothetical protein
MLFSLFMLPLVFAFPNGAPRCAINVTFISMGHEILHSQVGYNISVSNNTIETNVPISITVSGGQFKGLLMYVQGANSTKKHVGKFINIGRNFKPQTTICNTFNFTGDLASTITHSNSRTKPNNSVFQWVPLPGDNNDPGPFALRAVVTTGGPELPWQILDIPLVFANAPVSNLQVAPIIGISTPVQIEKDNQDNQDNHNNHNNHKND